MIWRKGADARRPPPRQSSGCLCRRRFGASGPFLFGGFTAADAMYAPVSSRFRTYLPDLSTYGDDGTAQAYVDALFALPAMAEWEEGVHRETRS